MITLDGNPVLSLRMTLPRVGTWVVRAELDADEASDGFVDLVDDSTTYKGTVVRSGVVAGVCYVEMVGGRGGLAGDVSARSFNGVTARTVLADTLAVMGEQLHPESTPSVLATRLPYWTRQAGRGGHAVSDLADHLGAAWRVLADGRVWMGGETWPTIEESPDAPEVDSDPGAGLVILEPQHIDLVPGVTLGTRRVGRVEHHFEQGEHLTTTYWEAA